MSRLRAAILVCAIGLSGPLLAQTAAPDQRGACGADYQKYCTGTQPGGGRVVACLNQHRDQLPGDASDGEARYIEAAINGILVGCIYLPNGNPQPGPKFDAKLKWFKRLQRHSTQFLKENIPAVLAGDYNVAPTPSDIYPTRSWDKDALIQPQSRAAFQSLLAKGWLDAIRNVHPSKPMFTFWDYKRNRWPRDAGLRLDHLLLSPALAPSAPRTSRSTPAFASRGASAGLSRR